MRRLLPSLLAVLLALSCTPGAGGATASPGPSTAPPPQQPAPSPQPVIAAPATLILDGSQAGLAPSGGQDHLDLAEAASLEQNQPLALTRYRSWGWVDEATRTWGGRSPSLDERLLLLTRAEGARQAFSDLAGQWLVPPMKRTSCPAALRLDDCAVGSSGSHAILVGRLGVYVVRFDADGVDVDTEAALQVEQLSA